MKPSIVAVLAFLAIAALLAGCSSDDSSVGSPSGTVAGDGGDLSYYTNLGAAFFDSNVRSDSATSALNKNLDAAETLDQQKHAINTFLDTMIAIFDDSIGNMDSLTPPRPAKEAHDSFLSDISQARSISQSLRESVAIAATADAALAVIDDFNVDVIALVDHAQSACRDLQAIADANNAGVNLQCEAE